ncbi:MAG: hypothetical protein V4519_02020 [Patescibacteria group bacterium]
MITGKIVIVETPDGQAPVIIRIQWVGVEMPCIAFDRIGFGVSGVVDGKSLGPKPGYIVRQVDAINALEQSAPEAAKWWRDRRFPQSETALFNFDVHCAEVTSPVPDLEFVTITLVTEEMQGDPNR